MRARLGRDRLDVSEPVAVKRADDAWVADRDLEAAGVRVVHDDVGCPGQRQRQQIAQVAVDDDELAGVGRAEQPSAIEPEPVRAVAEHREARATRACSQSMTTIAAGSRMLT